ncbi:MAG: LL-diaminopimelate aminotransferase [Proteobacteria bacterium]|nr:LL-diaminopimelate aminotransferase [Pseudomonadota bacterium]MDA1135155.1 LL-diaminopimelate aminotransferase [Pseudomonadota bacterium]
MRDEFDRIKRLPPYVFAEVNKLKAELRAKGKDIIDFGMGNPDMPTPKHIREKLKEAVEKPGTGRYSTSRGITGLRKAQASYYKRRFNVDLDPENEVVVTLGSKEGLANLAQAITSPGDIILSPNPSYPIHPYGFIIAGASLRHLPAMDEGVFNPNLYLERLDRSIRESVPAPVALIVSFPSNPTAQVASIDFYEEVVKIALKYGTYILSDLAYAEIYYDGNVPPSILQVRRAKEVAVEFTSMSKTYAMAGWRIGFAVGNKKLISALTRIKSYLDYGAFTPVQVAAVTALNGTQNCVDEIRNIYQKRRDVLISSMSRAGWNIPSPPASMFAWAPLPEKFKKQGSLAFAKELMLKADVAVAPGVAFGEYGEGFVRVGLVENEQRIRQAAKNIKKLLAYDHNQN